MSEARGSGERPSAGGSDDRTGSGGGGGSMRTAAKMIIVLAVILAVLHQDWWWWHDDSRLLGFLPIGLAFHILYSILAATLWAVTCRFAWPDHLDDLSDGPGGGAGSGRQGGAGS